MSKHHEKVVLSKSNNHQKQVFRLVAPQAKSVLLVGDFTRWQEHAISMTKGSDESWTTSVELPPGKHSYRFIVDGNWQDDPSCAERVPNPFGSQDMIREAA